MKKTKICPQCGSIDTTIPRAGMDLRLTIPDQCKHCHYMGNFPEVDINKVEEFRKNLTK